ncbi:putative heat shock protein 40 [Paratrimastix pyriformis]|uniref:Heat shock protein 40 n=1 Tax=Paratrimastix pyriformis TaxID=342808 RepID=A0ABQ8USC3_9EUKA|nr:putative heat shock protein 40 [Paratrimastix pyriformis]
MQYYDILEVKRDADVPTIKKQYKILAQKNHPSLHPDEQVDFERKYREITEAYEVLSNAKHRVIYDTYGMDGLKNGVPDGNGGTIGGGYIFASNPDEVFREAFGRNPFTEFFDFQGQTKKECAEHYTEFAQMSIQAPPEKPAPEKLDLECTLEELFNGATLQVPIRRLALAPTGASTYEVTDTLTIKVCSPLLHAHPGSRLRIAGPKLAWADPISSIVAFKRDGDDLRYTATITLGQALLGTIIDVPTLDGRTLSVGITDIVRPGYAKRVPGQGMPIVTAPPRTPAPAAHPGLPTAPGVLPTAPAAPSSGLPTPPAPVEALLSTVVGRGDLLIDFEVRYPERLTQAQRAAIQAAAL